MNSSTLLHGFPPPPTYIYSTDDSHLTPLPTSPSSAPVDHDLALYNAYCNALATLSHPTSRLPTYHQTATQHLDPIVPSAPVPHIDISTQTAAARTSPPRDSELSYRSAATSGASSRQMYSAQHSMGGGPTIQAHRGVKRTRSHQRTPSASTIASNGPASPYMQAVSYPHVVHADTSPNSPAYYADQAYTKTLPTPSHTPTESGFAATALASSHMGQLSNAHLAMKDFAILHHSESEQSADFAPSRQSMSSYGNNSPATPQSGVADVDVKAYIMPPTTDLRQTNPNVQLFRTESQAFQDELYHPNSYTSAPVLTSKPHAHNNFLSPNRLMAERLQTANLARSASPTSAISRERSPFRDGSPLAPTRDWRTGGGTAGTAAHMRRQQKEQTEQAELARHPPQLNREPTKTISPKDALLEYPDTDQPSLFQETLPVGYDTHRGGTEQWPTNYNAFGGLQPSGQQDMGFHKHATEQYYAGSGFEFQSPHQGQGPDQIHHNPFQANYQATLAARMNTYDNTPDFPATLPSMETSISDVGPGLSSQEDASMSMPPRPDDTRANTGAYTCTYHGCAQRFDSHINLQKHKRDSHRAQQPIAGASPSVSASESPRSTQSPVPAGSALSSAAILARNSQAGPHKCERINPSTGKPCNTIFSRPYDLTRHEDTIHNNRKQKVRCPYCREEKSFSRTDALTRHLRVVHPNVEAYGKRARRGD